MKKIHTIKGLLNPNDLGFTYTHEHLILYPPEIMMREDPDFALPNESNAIKELELFRKAGGDSLVEATAIDAGRDVKALKRIADSTEVNIIFTTGFNKGRLYPNWVIKAEVDELAELMINEIMNGVDNTGFKPGILKCGSWYNVIEPEEEKVTRAVARAHIKTGAPIWVHTEVGTMGLEQLDILKEENVDLTKVCIGHSDRNADLWYHKKILERGAYLGYDGPSKIKYYPDSVRIELIKSILKAGYRDKLLISGDMGRKSYVKSYGGGPGFEFILRNFIPRLLEEDLTKEDVEQIWVKNPAKYLAF